MSSTSTLQDLSTSPAQQRSDELAPVVRIILKKTQNKIQKRDDSRDADDRLRHLPDWLELFTDDQEDTEVHAPALISQDSDSERSLFSKHKETKKVHYATVMDMCHLKISELEPKLQK